MTTPSFGPHLLLPTVIPVARHEAAPAGSVRVRRGQYLMPQACPPDWEQMREVSLARVMATHRVCTGAHALSHESAALLHGAWVLAQEPDVHTIDACGSRAASQPLPRVVFGAERVMADGPHRPEGPDLRLGRQAYHRRHRMALPDHHLTQVHGLPVTSIARTMADCLMDLDGLDAFVVGDSLARVAVRPDRFAPDRAPAAFEALREEARRIVVASGRRHHKRRALRMLDLLSPFAESPGESWLRYLLLRQGVPVPVVQVPVDTEQTRFFADFGWPDARLAEEYDGAGKYTRTDAVFDERRRARQLERQGWRLLRAGFKDLRSPAALMSDLLESIPGRAYFPITPRPWMA